MSFFLKGTPLQRLNCKLVGFSIDGLYSQIAWLRTIKDKRVAKERMENQDEDTHCYDWFICTKKTDKETVLNKIIKK